VSKLADSVKLRQAVCFQAPPERVWAVFTDPAQWTKWNTEWAEIRDIRGPFDHPGAGYTQVIRVLGREHLGTWEVAACEPGRWREVRGMLPLGIPFHARDEFRAVPAGTEMSLQVSWDMPWGILGRLLARAALPLLRRQFRGNAARAAALLREGG
jgi:ligand-binding SRPBCC domain-containing protein